MRDVTVRQLMNELAREHGEMSWIAEYSDDGGSYRGVTLYFRGFDGWVVTMPARIR